MPRGVKKMANASSIFVYRLLLQVLYIDDKVKWKPLKEYEMDKYEHTESHEHQPLCGDTCYD
ncbi:hypothetical protein BN2127_JRS1_04845 [Bacillus cereus]|nr:hypothetical protein BN2127_JRS1_04845 [Bacillus cereus]